MLINLPNFISFIRLLSVPFIVIFILEAQLQLAFGIFLLASLSDLIDGYLARILKARTDIGSILDPIADKALLVALFLVFGYEHYISSWLVILVIFRDVLIVGGAIFLTLFVRSFHVKPLFISKVNTVVQALFICILFIDLAFYQKSLFHISLGNFSIKNLLELCVGITTLLSGWAYAKLGWQRITSKE